MVMVVMYSYGVSISNSWVKGYRYGTNHEKG